jgi:hypothetical protein
MDGVIGVLLVVSGSCFQDCGKCAAKCCLSVCGRINSFRGGSDTSLTLLPLVAALQVVVIECRRAFYLKV